ncbi:MAG: hypothetical protein ACOX6S_07055 [Clostridia bacterium]|jgi:hypothetical protein
MQQNSGLQMQRNQGRVLINGWKEQDVKQLLMEIRACRERGEALRVAFERVAERTGRKYNTVRNFYYTYKKELGGEDLMDAADRTINRGEDPEEVGGQVSGDNTIRFIPFTEQEKWDLMVAMLEAQGQGRSVRGCALELGKGDKTKMLRYQNKYRNMLKSDRQMVNDVMAYLEKEGRVYYNPFTKKRVGKTGQLKKSRGNDRQAKVAQSANGGEENQGQSQAPVQPLLRQESFVDILTGIIQDMEIIQSEDLVEFFKGIRNLTRLAARQLYSKKKADEYDRLSVKYDLLLIEAEKMEHEIQKGKERENHLEKMLEERDLTIEEMKSQILTLNNRIENQKENTNRLINMFRQLMGLNKQFLGLNPVNKVSSLNSYTSQLIGCMEEYEKVINEYE